MRRLLLSQGILRSLNQRHCLPIAPCVIGSRALSWDRPSVQKHVEADDGLSSSQADHVYPAQAGWVVGNKIHLMLRLGSATDSTVWLAVKPTSRSLRGQRYITMKLSNSSVTAATTQEEAWEFNRSQGTWFSTSRQTFVTNAMRPFGIRGPRATHQCTGYENTNKPHWMLGRHLCVDGPTHPHILKGLIPSVLRCLDFLHTACHAIHTDPQGNDFLLPVDDADVLQLLSRKIQAERLAHPGGLGRDYIRSLRKDVRLRSLDEAFEPEVILELQDKKSHGSQPGECTTPEVLLKTGWSYPADIWNLGLMLWEVVAGKSLLDGRLPGTSEFSDLTLFAQMVRLLGPPPPELLAAADGEALSRFYDNQGNFNHPELIPGEEFNFSTKLAMLEGNDKDMFIRFIKRMLNWVPEERATARELLDDPWLRLDDPGLKRS
ncbi:kinase-like domain-containing protein [Ilyonectria destructans]|nr:kinase-like domain-containing protein [Ilyonectria destructans]